MKPDPCRCPWPGGRTSPRTGNNSAVRRRPWSSAVDRRPGSAPPPAWCCHRECAWVRRQNRQRRVHGLPEMPPWFRQERRPRSNRRNGASRRQDSGHRTPPRRSPPRLLRSRLGLRLARGSAARTSLERRASTGARNPSRSYSRPRTRALPAIARGSAWRCAAAGVAGSCLLPEWRQWQPATDPAWAAAPPSAADTRAVLDTPASSAPSCGPDRTPVPLPAGSAPPHELPAVPLHTVPLCTYLRCPTKTHVSQRRRTWFVTPRCSRCPWNQNAAAGLLLLRHVTPLSRRDVVYFHSGAHNRIPSSSK